MKSYVKIYGPPIVKAFRALEKIAATSPEVLIASYFHALTPSPTAADELEDYFNSFGVPVPEYRRSQLISSSGHMLGENDFFFEWARDPTWKDLEELIGKIDEALSPLGCKYTIITR
jgi:hypothetical protein